MMPQIEDWLRNVAKPFLKPDIHVTEIGARNINGRARDHILHTAWIGWDTEPGPDVVIVDRFRDIGRDYDLVVACECFEHDPRFWETLREARQVVRRSQGHFIVTTPANGFPYHSFGGDFYRFTEDAYRQVFFADLVILDLRTIGQPGQQTVCGIAHAP